MYIEINLSIEKSGGEENLPKVINAVSEAVKEKFPEAEVIVRKGFRSEEHTSELQSQR